MIRKFARFDAPIDVVSEMFQDLERWPEWMPGVRSMRVLERSESSLTVETVQTQMGRTLRQIVKVRLGPRFLQQRQVRGRFRRWSADWRFLEPPGGRGTTVALELDIDLGVLGVLVPARTMQNAVDQIFTGTVRAARSRLQRLTADRAAAAVAAGAAGEPLIQVFLVDDVLEVRIGERRFRLDALE